MTLTDTKKGEWKKEISWKIGERTKKNLLELYSVERNVKKKTEKKKQKKSFQH